jgi:hypothetical protein
MTTSTTGQEIDFAFTGPITRDEATTGWTVIEVPGSAEAFGTRRPVKVGGTIDGHAFRATLLPTGNGPHMMPINAALRKVIGKDEMGDEVQIHLTQRFS